MIHAYLIIAASFISAQGDVSTQDPQLPRYDPHFATKEDLQAIYEDWEAALRTICEAEGIAAMVFDIEPAYRNVDPWTERYGAEAMRLLGYGAKRRWIQVDGVQVFTRVGFDYRATHSTDVLLSILASLDEEVVGRLGSEDLSLGDLGSIGDQMLPFLAWDPPMAKVLLDRGSSIRVQAKFAPQFEYRDPKTGRVVTDQLGTVDTGPTWSEHKVPSHPREPVPYEPHRPGPLDFGSGKVITLREFKSKAQTTFGTVYEIDARLMTAPVFVRGSMNKQTFEKVYREVASAQHPVEVRPAAPHDDLLRELLETKASPLAQEAKDELWGLSPDDFVQGKALTVGDLARLDPTIGEYLNSLGLAPSDQVRLKPGLIFTFDAGGTRTLGFSDAGGKRIEYGASNRIRLGVR